MCYEQWYNRAQKHLACTHRQEGPVLHTNRPDPDTSDQIKE